MSDRSITIQSFKFGLDSRREALVSQDGALSQLVNGHINTGGEIEQRLAFVDVFVGTSYDFTNTFGLLNIVRSVNNVAFDAIVTFCDYSASVANAGGVYPAFSGGVFNSLPVQVSVFKCRHPKGAFGGADDITMTGLLWAINVSGYPLCAAKFSDGNAFLYYGGSTTPAHPVDASVMGLVIATLTNGWQLAAQLTSYVNGLNGLTFTGWLAAMPVLSVALASGGAGYAANDVLTVVGGTVPNIANANATIKVLTVTAGAVTTYSLLAVGAYKTLPTNPVATTAAPAGGTGATFNLTFPGFTNIFSPLGITSVSYATPTTTDPTQSIGVQHVADKTIGAAGTSASALLLITAAGNAGDVFTAGVETAVASGVYTTVGTYTVLTGDAVGDVADGLQRAINTTVTVANVTASSSAGNVICYGLAGATALNGRRFQITATGAGTIGASTGNYAILSYNQCGGNTFVRPGTTGSVTVVSEPAVTVSTNVGTPVYAWNRITGSTLITATDPTSAVTRFLAAVPVDTTVVATFSCTVTGTGGPITTLQVSVNLSCVLNYPDQHRGGQIP